MQCFGCGQGIGETGCGRRKGNLEAWIGILFGLLTNKRIDLPGLGSFRTWNVIRFSHTEFLCESKQLVDP